ncbi:MAG: hypothetical protein ACP5I8_13730 [Phycisphaerae bacterium]
MDRVLWTKANSPDVPMTWNDALVFVHRVQGALQLHLCRHASCGKGVAGRRGCRFAYPRLSGSQHSQTRPVWYRLVRQEDGGVRCDTRELDADTETGWEALQGRNAVGGHKKVGLGPGDRLLAGPILRWELARPLEEDGRVVETNSLLAYVFASNTNVQLLGGERVGWAVAKYVAGYCCGQVPGAP